MFEFGRDLKKLFVQARESEDLSWLELIGVDLVEVEARQQSTDAGRVSCARPHAAWLRAAALWREHAERTGAAESLKRALAACADAARAARKPDDIARAAVAKAQTLLLRYDLCGDLANLERASEALPDPHPHDGKRALTGAIIGVTARIRARQARLAASQAETLRSESKSLDAKTTGASAILTEAIALLDAALKAVDSHAVEDLYDLRMDRASLALEAGVLDRNLQLLDQAGRELQQLVESASPDYRPLTRARALCLCGAGMTALGALANNDEALAQGQALFDAAADQFTADHSPLDWVAVQIVKSDVQMKVGDEVMRLAEALTTPERVGQTLILGATARERVLEKRIASAQAHNDLAGLELIESLVRRSLSKRSTQTAHEPSFETAQEWPVLDWVVDQMAMARIAHARLAMTGRPSCRSAGDMAMALMEAVEAARDHGCPAMAERAQGLIGGLVVSEKPSRA